LFDEDVMTRRALQESRFRTCLAGVLVIALTAAGTAQTPITAPKNKYSPQEDVEVGRKAAAQVEQQLPLLRNDAVNSLVDDVGRQLAAAIPAQFQHPEFRYTFQVVNAKDINAFALPGGPMFVNRGMIEAATREGEMAGVMAHELAHVALRHGTAQATKAQPYEIGALAGAVLGAIIGGTAGRVVAQGTQFGIGTYFLKFSREYEKQADLLGAQIMARAGYDPRDLARMFQTIERQGGSRAPQWMSDHPDPGSRTTYINQEAGRLRIAQRRTDPREFQDAKAALRSLPPALSSAEIARNAENGNPNAGTIGTTGTVSASVEPPSSRYVSYDEGNVFRISVPDNWRELSGSNTVRFAPAGAYGQIQGRDVFTHGVELGVVRNASRSLREANDEFIASLMRSNPNLRTTRSATGRIGGQSAMINTLTNSSEATGRPEVVVVKTMLLDDGTLFYAIDVAPQDEYGSYRQTFDRITRSIQFAR
jgi:hypothetical protein